MKHVLGIIVVLLLSYRAILPLLSHGYFPMHDDTQVARVNVMGKALKSGQFPVRWVTDLYRSEWQGSETDMPLLGVNRHVVVAPTDAEAMELARPAYALWRQHMGKLWYERTGSFPLEEHLPLEWDAAQAMGQGCAGAPETVRSFVAREIEVGRVT